MIWSLVDDAAKEKILAYFADKQNMDMFPPALTKIEKRRPRFYKHFEHYRVTNYAGMDGPSFKFISNGEDFHLLDGTPKAIYAVNDKEPLHLKEDHVVAYIAYFLRNVQGEKGELDLVINREKSQFITQISREERERVLEHEHNVIVSYNEEENAYHASGTIYYDGELIPATFHVGVNGRVSIECKTPVILHG